MHRRVRVVVGAGSSELQDVQGVLESGVSTWVCCRCLAVRSLVKDNDSRRRSRRRLEQAAAGESSKGGPKWQRSTSALGGEVR